LFKRYLVLPVVLIFSALAFAACGSSESEEDKIVSAIETSATSPDPANCEKLSTQAFMEQSTSSAGKEAVEKCEEDAGKPENNAESAAVSNVEVEGEEATAEVALTGGSFDGQSVVVALVKEDDQWKLNEITEFAKLDKGKLVEQLEVQFEKPSSEVSEEVATCVEKGIEESSQPEVEEYFLSGSSEALVALAESCS
jgi:hypothetical protein